MFRSLLLASVAFAWGSPQFADLRPQALDRPLVTFHYEVKDVTRDAMVAVDAVKHMRSLRFMDEYFSFITERVNG